VEFSRDDSAARSGPKPFFERVMSALHQPQGVAEKPSPIKGGGRTTAPPVSSSAALSYPERIMSAFTPIADSTRTSREVRFGPIASYRTAEKQRAFRRRVRRKIADVE
jgi:hypothetical protein